MEDIFEKIKKIKKVFPENEKYVIEIGNFFNNNTIFKIYSQKENCLIVILFEKYMSLNNLSKCGDYSGTKLLEKMDELAAQIPEIEYIELFDSSKLLLKNIKIDLAFFKILSTGQSWYNSHGYFSDNYESERINNEILREKILIEELDLIKEKIVNNKKRKREEKDEEKIDNLKTKLVNQFSINDKITIGDFFESIKLNNLTREQLEIVAELIKVIGVFIDYDVILKKTIGNSNNTNNCSKMRDTCNMMGGGKIKKKQTKNNQNETREYGTWKDGSSVYKDKNGYYIYSIRYDNDENSKGEEYKEYLKNWKPTGILYLDESKGRPGKWSSKKPIVGKKNKTLKYKNRPSPPYPANDWCGKNKKGNDGNIYTSKKNKNGVCRWVKV